MKWWCVSAHHFDEAHAVRARGMGVKNLDQMRPEAFGSQAQPVGKFIGGGVEKWTNGRRNALIR